MASQDTEKVHPHFLRKHCPVCGWDPIGHISFDYVYCPMCRTPLETFDWRTKIE